MAKSRFAIQILNFEAIERVQKVAEEFEILETNLKKLLPVGRDTSLTWTLLEDACFRAKRAVSAEPAE